MIIKPFFIVSLKHKSMIELVKAKIITLSGILEITQNEECGRAQISVVVSVGTCLLLLLMFYIFPHFLSMMTDRGICPKTHLKDNTSIKLPNFADK